MLFGQQFTLSGFVQNAETGEKLVGATVYDRKTNTGTITNEYGFYSINFTNRDSVELIVSFIGYPKQRKKIVVKQNETVHFHLKPGKELDEIIIESERIEQRTQMSEISIPIANIKRIPAIIGESDVIKSIQLLPGVQKGAEGGGQLFVRGGNLDQNLILLDEVPLYYVNHLGGFISIFNVSALNSIKFIKGAFPAEYGGRLSSVLDIKMKEGNLKKYTGEAEIGILSAKISFEGPIIKEKASFIISARRSVIDLFSRAFLNAKPSAYASAGYTFNDINAKLNYIISDKNRVYISLYTGYDKIYYTMKNQYNDATMNYQNKWGNILVNGRWNSIFSPKLFSSFSVSYLKYYYMNHIKSNGTARPDTTILLPDQLGQTKPYYFDSKQYFDSYVRDVNLKWNLDGYISNRISTKMGATVIFHQFAPGKSNFYEQRDSVSADTTYGAKLINSVETGIYVSSDIKITSKLKMNTGVRYSRLTVNRKIYQSFEPRFQANLLILKTTSLKASIAWMNQYVHLLSNTTVGMPVDLWVSPTDSVPPQKSWQAALGLAYSTRDRQIELSVETYYKKMSELIEIKGGVSLFDNSANWTKKIEINGLGSSYGLELMLQKKEGRTTGWISYTWSKTDRRFTNINLGQPYPFKYDRRNDINLVIFHQLKENINLSLVWTYSSGSPVSIAFNKYYSFYNISLPNGMNQYGSTLHYQYSSRNNFRLPSIHHLDIGITFSKSKKYGVRNWTIGIYNLYNRKNPYMVYFEVNGNDLKLMQLSLFPIMPSLSYSFKF